jgi:hypothetical protein
MKAGRIDQHYDRHGRVCDAWTSTKHHRIS